MVGKNVHTLRYWVQKVLPLVYDDSLSYYELLSRVVYKLNEVITSNDEIVLAVNEQGEAIEELRLEIADIRSGEYRQLIEEYIARAIKTVFFGLTDSGYFVAYIPESWSDITFNTTGYDITVPQTSEYGHLVLSY